MTSEAVRIGSRFRGPAQSGNGGYVAGRVGTALARITADLIPQVRLMIPPPLNTDLTLTISPADDPASPRF